MAQFDRASPVEKCGLIAKSHNQLTMQSHERNTKQSTVWGRLSVAKSRSVHLQAPFDLVERLRGQARRSPTSILS